MQNIIAPLSGWMLDRVVDLDQYHLGFAASYMRSSAERRQVVAAYLSKSSLCTEGFEGVVSFLLTAGHRAILRAAYGDVPHGLRGALGRSGSQPHEHKFYTILHQMLASPRHGQIAPAISEMAMIDLPRLRIANMLPYEACRAHVVDALGDVSNGKDAARVIELLVENGVDRDALGKAITSITSQRQLSRLWDRWAARCRLPEPPVLAAPGYRPVETADDLRKLARRYRNCAARYLAEALDGFSAFGEFLPNAGSPGMVVHLRRRPDGWEVDGLFLKHNARPHPDQRQRANDFLYASGVKQREQIQQADGQWSSLRRLTSRMVWDLDDD